MVTKGVKFPSFKGLGKFKRSIVMTQKTVDFLMISGGIEVN